MCFKAQTTVDIIKIPNIILSNMFTFYNAISEYYLTTFFKFSCFPASIVRIFEYMCIELVHVGKGVG